MALGDNPRNGMIGREVIVLTKRASSCCQITKPYASDELIIITGVDTVQKMAHFFNYKNGAPSPLHALPEGPKCKDRPECYVTGGVMFYECNTSAPAGPKVVMPDQGVRPRAPYSSPGCVYTRDRV